jgi:glycosyltransferase involved in cell wall biosynthesis
MARKTQNKKIGIAVILPSARGGGAEKTLIRVVSKIDKTIFSPTLILIDGSGPNLELIPKDVPLTIIGKTRVSRALYKLICLLYSIKPKIVFCSIFHLNLMILISKTLLPRSIKIIIRESNIPSHSISGLKNNRLFKKLVRIYYPKAKSIICLGEGMKQDLVENFGISPNLIVNIPNPIDKGEIEQKLAGQSDPFPNSKRNILAVGSLTEQKGFDLLIQAFGFVLSKHPDAHLTIIGEGKLRGDLESLIQRNKLSKSVNMPGYRFNPYPYYKFAELFVLSSHFEGLPNAVLEAVACGTPVIAFDCPGCIRDILISSSQGQLVPAGNIQALAEAISKNLDKKSQINRISHLPAKFELNQVMDAYHGLFKSCSH